MDVQSFERQLAKLETLTQQFPRNCRAHAKGPWIKMQPSDLLNLLRDTTTRAQAAMGSAREEAKAEGILMEDALFDNHAQLQADVRANVEAIRFQFDEFLRSNS